MRLLQKINICLIMGFLAGCSSAMSNSDFVGKYEVKYPYGVETIELKSDGSFDQGFKFTDGGKELNQTGRWEYEPKSPIGQRIKFHEFLIIDDFGKPDQRIGQVGSSWNGQVKKTLIGTEILINPDLGYSYKKVSD